MSFGKLTFHARVARPGSHSQRKYGRSGRDFRCGQTVADRRGPDGVKQTHWKKDPWTQLFLATPMGYSTRKFGTRWAVACTRVSGLWKNMIGFLSSTFKGLFDNLGHGLLLNGRPEAC